MNLMAQSLSGLIQPLNWEQASNKAVRENLLVMVEVGDVKEETRKAISSNQELLNYISRNVVAFHMDMNSVQGKLFENKLLQYDYPAYAFFQPYGDLLAIVQEGEVISDPEYLRNALDEAHKMAQIKKHNSRSIRFQEMTLEQALDIAGKMNKNIFVNIADINYQPSLLMTKNVFNLDKVADFYNRNFISLDYKVRDAEEMIAKYGIKTLPAYLFLNADGKLLHVGQGYCSSEQFIQHGESALKKAQGISFQSGSRFDMQKQARHDGKYVFLDVYVDNREHQELEKYVFKDPELADFFHSKFVCVREEGKNNCLIFTDGFGRELHRILKVDTPEQLLEEGKKAISGKGLAGMHVRYRGGLRTPAFMESYMKMLSEAGFNSFASRVAGEYFDSHNPDCLLQSENWLRFNAYVQSASPKYFDYVLAQRTELKRLYGSKDVKEKVRSLCINNVNNYVQKGVFDEEAFKVYAKRLKKEKIENHQSIVRDARMKVAERLKDWKSFVNLAEEKWNEEKVSDAELYRWALKIDEECKDGNVRYKMAQWLRMRVMEINRKEKLTGKVNLTSYRGFFEKLIENFLN